MDQWLLDNLRCPRDRKALTQVGDHLTCADDHRYRIVNGIPVMLFDDGSPTHGYIRQSLDYVVRIDAGEPESDVVDTSENVTGDIDEFVKRELPYTCGNLYFSIQDKLARYPFPDLRMPDGGGKRLLDIGCNWGRWTVPLAQTGYNVVGIDPSLNAVLAARRIARQHNVEPQFVVGDARFLPFADDAFDIAFSYSVIQHLNKPNANLSFNEMSRIVRPGGTVRVQMPNKFGVRCIYHQARMGFREGREGADVFYWSPSELLETFRSRFGNTELSVDCFFGLNIQGRDVDIMPFSHRIVIRSSEFLRGISRSFGPLIRVADSLYLTSINNKQKAASAARHA